MLYYWYHTGASEVIRIKQGQNVNNLVTVHCYLMNQLRLPLELWVLYLRHYIFLRYHSVICPHGMGLGCVFRIVTNSRRHGPHPRVTLVKGEWKMSGVQTVYKPWSAVTHQSSGETSARGTAGQHRGDALSRRPFLEQVELVCHPSPQSPGRKVLIFTSWGITSYSVCSFVEWS